jgi:hypothetical protein
MIPFKQGFTLILFLFVTFILKSQESDFITKYNEKIYVYKDLFQDFNNIKDNDQHFLSNNYTKISIGLDYKFLTLSYAKEIKAIKKGGNDNFVFRYGINLDRLRFSFRYDFQSFDSIFSIKNYSSSVIYFLNPNRVNYGSSFFYTSNQIKSGHSFLVETSGNYINENNDNNSLLINAGIGSLACFRLGKNWRLAMKNSILPISILNSSFRFNSFVQVGIVKGKFFSMLNFYCQQLYSETIKLSQYGWKFTLGMRFL